MSWLDRLRRRRAPIRRATYEIELDPKTAHPGGSVRVTLTMADDAGGDDASGGALEVALVCRARADGSLVRQVVAPVPEAAGGTGSRVVEVALPADAPTTEEGGEGVRDWHVVARAVGGGKVAVPVPLWVAAGPAEPSAPPSPADPSAPS